MKSSQGNLQSSYYIPEIEYNIELCLEGTLNINP